MEARTNQLTSLGQTERNPMTVSNVKRIDRKQKMKDAIEKSQRVPNAPTNEYINVQLSKREMQCLVNCATGYFEMLYAQSCSPSPEMVAGIVCALLTLDEAVKTGIITKGVRHGRESSKEENSEESSEETRT